ncbi:MAG: tetratricopeptide repeat protein [Myxococcota bacterium]
MSRPAESAFVGSRGSETPPTVTDPGFAAHESVVDTVPVESVAMLGRFEIRGELGRGGMGVVLEAYDPTLDRRVALKLLSAELDEQRAGRLLREAQALGRLSHPNVVSVYEVGTVDAQGFIAMELVEGQSLRRWHERPRPWPEVLDVYLQAGRGLAAAHAEGLVHRDFKPANCLISASGRVRVVDFGLAGDVDELRRRGEQVSGDSFEEAALDMEHSEAGSPFEERLTRPGAVIGTPGYMSPEQRQGRGWDARSDQYSFAVSICEALFGEDALPRRRADLDSKVWELAERSGRRLPRALRRALARALAPEPDERWPSMTELLRALERCRRSGGRRRGMVALVVANVALVAVLWGRGEADEPPCGHARQRLHGVWDEGRAAAVAAAILGTGVPYARNTEAAVRARMAEYAAGWAQLHNDTCEAALLRGELSAAGFDRRMQCLDERRQALDHVAEQLLEADAEVVEQAVHVVAGLPALPRCADARALQAEPQPPPEQAEAVASVRTALDRARTRLRAGKYDVALQAISAALAQAEPLGHAPLLAEARLLRGDLYLAMGRYEDAAADLRRAQALALRHEHAEVAAEASAGLTFVVGVPMAQYEGAVLLGESALALAQRVDEGGQREAEALVGIAQVLAKHGEDAEAETHFVRALELLGSGSEVDPRDRVGALDGLRGVLRRQGRHAEAERLARDAVALVGRELGPEHPAMVPRLANLAAVLMARGQHAEAESELRAALTLGGVCLPPGHPVLAHVHGNLGAVLLYQERPDEAVVELERALSIWERVHSAEHDLVADALANLGVAARGQGRSEDAVRYYERALTRYAEVYEPHHPKVARVELNLGKVLQVLERGRESEAHLKRALAAYERYGGAEHVGVGKTLAAWGLLDFQQGRLEQARERQGRALEIFERAYPAEPARPSEPEVAGPRVAEPRGAHPRVARALWALGRTEVELGEVELGRQRLEQALRIQREVEVRAIDRARTEWALARLQWRRPGERTAARALAQQALDRLGRQPDRAAEQLRDEIRARLDGRR